MFHDNPAPGRGHDACGFVFHGIELASLASESRLVDVSVHTVMPIRSTQASEGTAASSFGRHLPGGHMS